MRYGLVEDGKCEFAIGLGLGGCLTIYRRSAMAKIVEKFRAMQHVAKFQRFFTLFFSTLFHTECDKIGRVMLPATLRQAIGAEKEIVVAGVLDKIEIWPKQVYERNLAELLNESESDLTKMAEEAFALLAGADVPAQETPSILQGLPPHYAART